MQTVTSTTPRHAVTTLDICDKKGCPARAIVAVRMPSGRELGYCGHDFDSNEQALRQAAMQVFDLRRETN